MRLRPFRSHRRFALLLALVVAGGCLDAPPEESREGRRAGPSGETPVPGERAAAAAEEGEESETGELDETRELAELHERGETDELHETGELDEAGDAPRVLFVGTSLTAGLGLAEEEAYPALVADLLRQRGVPIEAVNAGVSGDTSAGGLDRLDWLLREPPAVVVVELGANDGLRGLPVEMTETNLLAVIARARAVEARVVVAGMKMPPNYGADYTERFANVFPLVAGETGSILIPFLLQGVAADPELNLPDGIHPNAEGHERIARTVLPYLVEALAGQ